MRKKAFTLVELMGVIIILGIIALLLVPTINSSIKNFRKDSYQRQLKSICLATSSYSVDHFADLPSTDGEVATITLGNLKSGDYVDVYLKNPMTQRYFPNDMLIELTKNGKNYDCHVIEDSGTNVDEYVVNSPVLTLLGSSHMVLELFTPFEEPGYIARTMEGKNITEFVTVSGQDSIDTSRKGTYEVLYTIIYNGETVTMKRIVEAKDMTSPVITVDGHRSDYEINVEAGNFTPPAATVTDNSGENITAVVNNGVTGHEVGKKKVVYTATDSEGNETVLTLTVNVTDTTAPEVTILGNPTSYTNQSVTLAVNANDVGTGLADKPYSFDGGTTWVSGNTKLYGTNQTVQIWVKDKEGNITKKTVVIDKIDKTAPDMTFAVTEGTAGNNYWYKSGSIKVKMTPSAGVSGIKEYLYCTTTGSSCTPTTKVTGNTATTVTLNSQSASNKVCVSVVSNAKDSSGNNVTNTKCSGNYKIDSQAPVITVDGHTSSFRKTGYTSDPAGTATDNLTSSVSVTKSGSVNKNASGTYTVTYSASDEAGNTASLVMTVVVTCSSGSSSQQTPHFGNRSNYSGSSHTLQFTAPGAGTYTFELYGGASVGWGTTPGTGGGYLKGSVYLNGGETIKVVTGAIGGWIGCFDFNGGGYENAGSTIAYINGTRIMEAQGGSMNKSGSRRYGKGDYYHASNVTVITSANQNWQTNATGCPNRDKRECAAEGEAKVSYTYQTCSS